MVKILERPENQKSGMMDSLHERQSARSSAGVCNGAGEPRNCSSKMSTWLRRTEFSGGACQRGCGCRIPSDARWRRSEATRAQSSGESGLRGQTRHHPRLVPAVYLVAISSQVLLPARMCICHGTATTCRRAICGIERIHPVPRPQPSRSEVMTSMRREI